VAEEPELLSPKSAEERSLIGSETVLLVEDDEALRELGRLMLEAYGYTVYSPAMGRRPWRLRAVILTRSSC
jgi:hypothetical protein